MSSRKRHTAVLDFMRTFIAAERGLCSYPYGHGWVEMVERLIKRGWLERKRTPGTRPGKFQPERNRRNHLYSTAKGRRAVYRSDRNAFPKLRKQPWNFYWGGSYMGSILKMEAIEEQRRARTSSKIGNLHSKRPRKIIPPTK